jgi:hypothetical protein
MYVVRIRSIYLLAGILEIQKGRDLVSGSLLQITFTNLSFSSMILSVEFITLIFELINYTS